MGGGAKNLVSTPYLAKPSIKLRRSGPTPPVLLIGIPDKDFFLPETY